MNSRLNGQSGHGTFKSTTYAFFQTHSMFNWGDRCRIDSVSRECSISKFLLVQVAMGVAIKDWSRRKGAPGFFRRPSTIPELCRASPFPSEDAFFSTVFLGPQPLILCNAQKLGSSSLAMELSYLVDTFIPFSFRIPSFCSISPLNSSLQRMKSLIWIPWHVVSTKRDDAIS